MLNIVSPVQTQAAFESLDDLISRFQRSADPAVQERLARLADRPDVTVPDPLHRRREALEQQCYACASFGLDRGVTFGRADHDEEMYEQWAYELVELGRLICAIKSVGRLTELAASHDRDLAYTADLVTLAAAGSRPDVVEGLRQAAFRPGLLSGVRSCLSRLADELFPTPEGNPISIECDDAVEVRLETASSQRPAFQTGALADKKQPPRKHRTLDSYAIGLKDEKTWITFQKRSGQWQEGRRFAVAAGREQKILKALAEGGGYLQKRGAIKLIYDHSSGMDTAKIVGSIIKTNLSRLRSKIRKAFGLPDDIDPLPWQKDSRGWRAAVEIGFAVDQDSEYCGAKNRLIFKTKEKMNEY